MLSHDELQRLLELVSAGLYTGATSEEITSLKSRIGEELNEGDVPPTQVPIK